MRGAAERSPKLRTRAVVVIALTAVIVSTCGTGTVAAVADGTYRAIVPSAEQFAATAAADIPGGFALLRAAAIDRVDMAVAGDEVTFLLDGIAATTRSVVERIVVIDSDGSGPLKGRREVLDLGAGPMSLGELTIEHPVVWSGSFETSPVVTVKPWNADERGPAVSCTASENCLLLSAGVGPEGRYADANNPARGENPIVSVEISAGSLEFTLDSGAVVHTDRVDKSTIACGLSVSLLWDVPEAVELAFDDPVLIHTLCPSVPGSAVQLVIMERAAIPVLASLNEATDGEWCQASSSCLWFVPE